MTVLARPVTPQQIVEQRANRWGGEVCKRCGRDVVVGFSVPDDIWLAVIGDAKTVRCLWCFDQIASSLGIDWAADVTLWPVAGCAIESLAARCRRADWLRYLQRQVVAS